MHQTFYIDIDEEITSIVDRLRKAKAKEVVIVVPKRALLIQSIVNLKLLRKESERFKKEITIVTQDQMGKALLEKIGLKTEQKLDDVSGEEVDFSEKENNEIVSEKDAFYSDVLAGNADADRLKKLGSDEYFDSSDAKSFSEITKNAPLAKNFSEKTAEENREKIINKELVVDSGRNRDSKKMGRGSSIDIARNINDAQLKNLDYEYEQKSLNENEYALKKAVNSVHTNINKKPEADSEKKEKMGLFFRAPEKAIAERKKEEYRNISLSGGAKKTFWIFGAAIFLIMASSVAYLFLPKADIKIFLKTKTKSTDVEIRGDAGIQAVDLEKQAIPIRIVSVEDTLSETINTTGKKSINNQKAKGVIIVYNEYSANAQPLVATTRFMSESGKIFRLVKGISVPGMSMVGEEKKAGSIEAEVVADEPGEAYNIEPTKFSIPGFQGSGTEKYTKIYAKSEKTMSGGGNGSSGETIKIISAGDISNAKNKLMAEINESIKQKIKEAAGEGAVVLEDAMDMGSASYVLSSSEGAVADSFNISVKVNATAIVFSESDAEKIAMRLIAISEKNGTGGKVDENSVSLQYGKADADFSKKVILIRANASGKIIPKLDSEALKNNILGKNEDEFMTYLKEFSDTESVEISYWPAFLGGKIPSYGSRVSIIFDPALDNN